MNLSKKLTLFVLTVFAMGSVACGDIVIDQTLALDETASSITITIPSGGVNTATVDLEGGVSTQIALSIDLITLIFGGQIFGAIEVTDLLFAGNGFTLLIFETGDICVDIDDEVPGGGTVLVDLKASMMSFAFDIGTRILVTNPELAGTVPGGFPFAISVDASQEATLVDLLGLALGQGDGGLALTQSFSDTIAFPIGPFPNFMIDVDATVTLQTANEIPSSERLDFCVDYLATL